MVTCRGEKAFSCRGLEPGGTEAQDDVNPSSRIWKLPWASTSILGFDPTPARLVPSAPTLTSCALAVRALIHWTKLGRKSLASMSLVCLEGLL